MVRKNLFKGGLQQLGFSFCCHRLPAKQERLQLVDSLRLVR
jgi:hypothetical protein